MQEGPAHAIDCGCVHGSTAGRNAWYLRDRSHLREPPFPAAADADDVASELRAAIDHRLDDRVQFGNVATSRKYADTLVGHL